MIEFEDKTCFGCGEENKCGLRLKLKYDKDTKTAYGEYVVTHMFEGPPILSMPG